MALARINGLFLNNIKVIIPDHVFKRFDRPAAAIYETENGIVRSISRKTAGIGGKQPVVSMHNCQNLLLSDCLALDGTHAFLGLTGNKTSRISLAGNDLSKAEKPVIKTEEVPSRAVKN